MGWESPVRDGEARLAQPGRPPNSTCLGGHESPRSLDNNRNGTSRFVEGCRQPWNHRYSRTRGSRLSRQLCPGRDAPGDMRETQHGLCAPCGRPAKRGRGGIVGHACHMQNTSLWQLEKCRQGGCSAVGKGSGVGIMQNPLGKRSAIVSWLRK